MTKLVHNKYLITIYICNYYYAHDLLAANDCETNKATYFDGL